MTEVILMRRPIIFWFRRNRCKRKFSGKKQAVLNEEATVFVFQDGWQKEMAWRRDYPGLPDRELSGILLNQMMSFFSR